MQPARWMRDTERGAYVQHLRAQQVAQREIASVLMDAAKDAERQIARIVDPRAGAQVRRAQLQTATEELRRTAAGIFNATDEATLRGIRSATTAAAEGHETLVRLLAEAGADARLGTQFSLAARAAADRVRGKVVNDVQLAPHVYRNQEAMVRRANAVVSRGLAQGNSAKEIARNVRGFISPNTPGGANYASMRLARTEINNSFHAVNTRMYDQSPFVEAVQWNLSGSHGRPDTCDELADDDHENLGQGVFSPNNVPFKPHPQCLCYTVAVTVPPERFRDNLLAGRYNEWMTLQGVA